MSRPTRAGTDPSRKIQHGHVRRLADTSRPTLPDKENLFATVEYDRTAWERVQHGVDRWARR